MSDVEQAYLMKIIQGSYGWIFLVVFYFVLYFLFEIGLTFIPGDLSAIIWIPFHFFVTPILGFLASTAILILTIRRKKIWAIITSLLCASIIVYVSYIGISGNTLILNILGVTFQHGG